jgi:predicted Zn-dependent protease
MTQSAETLFDEGIARYQAGEGPDTLIPVFKDICDRTPKNSSAWTCLTWLYLLDHKPSLAYKAGQKAVKLNPHDPQARVNLVAAMLESNQKGIRPHIDMALQLIIASSELRDEVKQNIEEGLSRNPDWDSLNRVKKWLFEV